MVQPYRYSMNDLNKTPLGSSYDFWKANPWQNMFGDLTKNYGNLGNKYLGQYAGMTPEQMRLKFGWGGGVGPNDPVLGQWTAQMRGNVGNELRQGADRMANAGIASSRGGYGLPGADLRSVLGQQANQQVAGMASQNFSNAVNYENQRRQMDNLVASALADFAGKQMNTGLGLMGLQLQGTQSADASKANWLQNAGAAFGKDTDLYNQMVTSEPQRRYQDAQMKYGQQQMERQGQQGDMIARLLQKAYESGMPWDMGGYQARGFLDRLLKQGGLLGR